MKVKMKRKKYYLRLESEFHILQKNLFRNEFGYGGGWGNHDGEGNGEDGTWNGDGYGGDDDDDDGDGFTGGYGSFIIEEDEEE